MALVVPNIGETALLKKMFNQEQTTTLLLKLYYNDATPNAFSTLSSFSECGFSGDPPTPNGSFPGYTNATITNSNWVVATPVGATYAEAGYGEQTFTFNAYTSAQTVFGYYVTDTLNNLLWAERFTNAPFTLPPAGGTIAVTLTINLENV
jgi:hypothetical protein